MILFGDIPKRVITINEEQRRWICESLENEDFNLDFVRDDDGRPIMNTNEFGVNTFQTNYTFRDNGKVGNKSIDADIRNYSLPELVNMKRVVKLRRSGCICINLYAMGFNFAHMSKGKGDVNYVPTQSQSNNKNEMGMDDIIRRAAAFTTNNILKPYKIDYITYPQSSSSLNKDFTNYVNSFNPDIKVFDDTILTKLKTAKFKNGTGNSAKATLIKQKYSEYETKITEFKRYLENTPELMERKKSADFAMKQYQSRINQLKADIQYGRVYDVLSEAHKEIKFNRLNGWLYRLPHGYDFITSLKEILDSIIRERGNDKEFPLRNYDDVLRHYALYGDEKKGFFSYKQFVRNLGMEEFTSFNVKPLIDKMNQSYNVVTPIWKDWCNIEFLNGKIKEVKRKFMDGISDEKARAIFSQILSNLGKIESFARENGCIKDLGKFINTIAILPYHKEVEIKYIGGEVRASLVALFQVSTDHQFVAGDNICVFDDNLASGVSLDLSCECLKDFLEEQNGPNANQIVSVSLGLCTTNKVSTVYDNVKDLKDLNPLLKDGEKTPRIRTTRQAANSVPQLPSNGITQAKARGRLALFGANDTPDTIVSKIKEKYGDWPTFVTKNPTSSSRKYLKDNPELQNYVKTALGYVPQKRGRKPSLVEGELNEIDHIAQQSNVTVCSVNDFVTICNNLGVNDSNVAKFADKYAFIEIYTSLPRLQAELPITKARRKIGSDEEMVFKTDDEIKDYHSNHQTYFKHENVNVLHLEFDDNIRNVDPKTLKSRVKLSSHELNPESSGVKGFEYQGNENVWFTNEMAQRVKEFVDRFNNPDIKFVVHCTAGRSRSAAIGYYIARKTKQEINSYFSEYETYRNGNHQFEVGAGSKGAPRYVNSRVLDKMGEVEGWDKNYYSDDFLSTPYNDEKYGRINAATKYFLVMANAVLTKNNVPPVTITKLKNSYNDLCRLGLSNEKYDNIYKEAMDKVNIKKIVKEALHRIFVKL